MKASLALATHRETIRRIVAPTTPATPRVFGSAAHGQDSEGSDLDLLIDPTPETSLFDIGAIRYGLLQLIGVQVEVMTPKPLREVFR